MRYSVVFTSVTGQAVTPAIRVGAVHLTLIHMTNDPSRLLIVASTRGPVSYSHAPDGSLAARRGGGGMVSGMSSGIAAVAADGGALWLCAALSDADREAGRAPAG